MNYSIYLTDSCNLDCKYCYEKEQHLNRNISLDYIKSIVRKEIKDKTKDCILTFFGGEPLLKKDIIYEIDSFIKSQKSSTRFWYNMTTNGMLVDDKFADFVANNNFISLSYSIDGISHNENRVMKNDIGTYELVVQNAKKLLNRTSVLVAVPVITRNNCAHMYDNVIELLKIGFQRISIQFDFTAKWTDEDLDIIKNELSKIAKLYVKSMRDEKEFHILGIDEKIRSYIDDKIDVNDNCSVGMRGINVGTDGNFYPCMQFMYNEKYVIGNYIDGINHSKQVELNKMLKKEMDECKECALRRRCNHTCSCINKALTGNADLTSPFTCEIEKAMINISDGIAVTLYSEKNPVFMQKYYNNDYFTVESMIKRGNNKYGTKKSRKS